MSVIALESRARRRFACGPLDVRVRSEDPTVRAKVSDVLALYNVDWQDLASRVDLTLWRAPLRGEPAAGTYLSCARMQVDHTLDGLYASTDSGATGTCIFDDRGERWEIYVPEGTLSALDLIDIEDLVGLVLTTGWRRNGFVPIHAAAVQSKDDRCAMICATSGGGKTTFTAALVRNGWKTLGDDKILLKHDENGPRIYALVHVFNLHPQTRAWFPEVGNLEFLPKYSVWSEKRRVYINTVWPGAGVQAATPTHIVQLDRREGRMGISIMRLSSAEALPTLLRQTVLPTDSNLAKHILSTVAATARVLSAVRLEVGTDAYQRPNCVETFDAFLR